MIEISATSLDELRELLGGSGDAELKDALADMEKIQEAEKAMEDAESEEEFEAAMDSGIKVCMKRLDDDVIDDLTEIRGICFAVQEMMDDRPMIIPVEVIERYNELVAKHFDDEVIDSEELLSMIKKGAVKHRKYLREKFS